MNQKELKETSLKLAQSIKEVKTNGNFYNDPFPHFFR